MGIKTRIGVSCFLVGLVPTLLIGSAIYSVGKNMAYNTGYDYGKQDSTIRAANMQDLNDDGRKDLVLTPFFSTNNNYPLIQLQDGSFLNLEDDQARRRGDVTDLAHDLDLELKGERTTISKNLERFTTGSGKVLRGE